MSPPVISGPAGKLPRAAHPEAAPLGGKVVTPFFMTILTFGLIGGVLMLYRFVFGLSTITNVNDTWPWGIWKPLNVVTATGVGAGGYGLAIIVYVLNKGRYHPFVRPALLTSALAYTVAAASVLVDLGRWWLILKVPVYIWEWNGSSVLLEVSICVLSYMLVLWTEVSPAVFGQLGSTAKASGLRRFAQRVNPKLLKAMPFIIALGVLLPSLHQSSLGGMFMVSSYLHPLWHTAFLPLLFLLSCLVMGYAGVVAQDTITRAALRRRQEYDLLPRLSVVAILLVGAWWGIRLVDLAWNGRLGLAFALDRFSVLFLIEAGLAFGGVLLLARKSGRENPGVRFGAALLLLASGALYRFSTYLLALQPRQSGSYFPSLGEVFVSLGLFSLAMCVFILIARKFPIIVGPAPRAPEVSP